MHFDFCPICKRKFPDEPITLVTEAYIDGRWQRMCPLCYADNHKEIHGTAWKPKGEIAKDMYRLARKWIKNPDRYRHQINKAQKTGIYRI